MKGSSPLKIKPISGVLVAAFVAYGLHTVKSHLWHEPLVFAFLCRLRHCGVSSKSRCYTHRRVFGQISKGWVVGFGNQFAHNFSI